MSTPSLPWEVSRDALSTLKQDHPKAIAMIQRLEELSSEVDRLGLLVMDATGSVARKNFLSAVFARTRTLFDGIVCLIQLENYLGAVILLRAFVEVLAATAYVRKYPQHVKALFNPRNRPGLEKRIQVLVSEWDPKVRDIYRELTEHFHFNSAHYQLQRIHREEGEVVLAQVFGYGDELVASLLATVIRLAEKQLTELRDIVRDGSAN